jgi:hypothetical protein
LGTVYETHANDKRMDMQMEEIERMKLFLAWAEKKAELDEIAKKIEEETLQNGGTLTYGNITASYRKASDVYDYESAAKAENPDKELVERHTTTTTKVSWKKVCNALGIDEIPVTDTKPATVTVKLKEKK